MSSEPQNLPKGARGASLTVPSEDCLASLFQVQTSKIEDEPIADPALLSATFQAIPKMVDETFG